MNIAVYEAEPNVQYDIGVMLVVNTSMTKPCPNNCSGRGHCDNGVCTLCSPYSGYDCSVLQRELGSDNTFSIAPGKFEYARYTSNSNSKSLTFSVQKTGRIGTGYLDFKFND